MYHNENGWTYAASGFTPGDGDICRKSVDQAVSSNLANGEEGSYKRVNLNQFITGSEKQGVLIQIVTGSNNSINNMDVHISALSEELF